MRVRAILGARQDPPKSWVDAPFRSSIAARGRRSGGSHLEAPRMTLGGAFYPRAVKAAPVPCCGPSWPYLGSAMTVTDTPTPPRHTLLDEWTTALLERIDTYVRALDDGSAAIAAGLPVQVVVDQAGVSRTIVDRIRSARGAISDSNRPADRELLTQAVAQDAAPTSEAGRR
jgi:hypothetical protein